MGADTAAMALNRRVPVADLCGDRSSLRNVETPQAQPHRPASHGVRPLQRPALYPKDPGKIIGGMYKAEKSIGVARGRPRNVEPATLQWVARFNHQRLLEFIGCRARGQLPSNS